MGLIHRRTRYIASLRHIVGTAYMPSGVMLIIIMLLFTITPTHAQLGGDGRDDDTNGDRRAVVTPTHTPDDTPVTNTTDESTRETNSNAVSIEAADGLTLHGAYYPASGGRAVLLLHQLYTDRRSWGGVIGALGSAGYSVLAVDLRGWGASRGAIDWGMAQQDTQSWLDWLYAQDGVRSGGVYLMGASMGANLALVGCMDAPACAGAVALSPGRSYFGVYADAALSSGFPALIAYAENDAYPRRDMPALMELSGFSADVYVYPGRAHGMALFAAHDDLMTEILAWLR